jgi:hypothetical protein
MWSPSLLPGRVCDVMIKPGRGPRLRMAALGLFLCCSLAAGVRAQEDSSLVEKLPEPVQGALEKVAEAHRPRDEVMRGPLRLSRARLGSGTSWLPASSPMYGLMAGDDDWGFMLRGNIFAGYAGFSSERGTHDFLTTNTLLGMGWHSFGRHELMLRLALSWEALTNRGSYALIGQTDDDARQTLPRDRQLAQELFVEASLTYTVALNRDSALQLYVAASGEPAIGPPAFNYRVSAFSDPLPPITQGRLESLPAYGVVTAGWFSPSVKLEGSWFNAARSPASLYDLDFRVPASFALRVAVNPRRAWSSQLSYGYLNVLDRKDGGQRAQRLTGSVTYNRRLGLEANWASTAAFGFRRPPGGPARPGVLLESTWNIEDHHTLFGRIEYERTSAARLGMLAVGYVYYFRPLVSMAPGLGARFSISPLDADVEPYYGTRVPVGWMAYFQLRPAALAVQREPSK